MKVQINKNNGEFTRQVVNRVKLNRIKAKIRWRHIKFIFIGVVSLFIIVGLIRTPIAETKALQTLDVETNIIKTYIKWNNKNYSVQVWKDRIKTMKNLGYSDTRILDLLTILNMECGSYKGNCFNGNEIGPFQINKIHKEQYNKSWKYYNKKDWGGLFVYQLKYANKLIDSYDARFCSSEIFAEVGKKYTNKARWECIGKSYNGHPRYKHAYVKLGWERRQVISNLIYGNDTILGRK